MDTEPPFFSSRDDHLLLFSLDDDDIVPSTQSSSSQSEEAVNRSIRHAIYVLKSLFVAVLKGLTAPSPQSASQRQLRFVVGFP